MEKNEPTIVFDEKRFYIVPNDGNPYAIERSNVKTHGVENWLKFLRTKSWCTKGIEEQFKRWCEAK